MLITAHGAVGSLTYRPYPLHTSIRKGTWAERSKQAEEICYELWSGHKTVV